MPSCFLPTPHAKEGGGGGWDNPLYFLNPLLYESKVLHTIRRLFIDFWNVEMDEISFVWLPWQPANEQVLFAHIG